MRFDPALLVLLLLAAFVTPRDSEPEQPSFHQPTPAPAPIAMLERVSFARGGFSIELPEGWDGPAEVDEAGLPYTATYRFRNRATGPLAGAEIAVVRRTGLNPMMRERWLQGRVPLGMEGARAVEALSGARMPFTTGAGLGVEAGARRALVYLTARVPAYYMVTISAPARGFAANDAALVAIARSIVFTGAEASASTTEGTPSRGRPRQSSLRSH